MIIEKLSQKDKDLIYPLLSKRPVPIGEIAESFNIEIKVSSNLPMNIGSEVHTPPPTGNQILIKINKYFKQRNQRFLIARETSRILLNRHNNIHTTDIHTDKDYCADVLATELLLPIDYVKDDLIYLRDNLYEENFEMVESKWEVNKYMLRIALTLYDFSHEG